MPAHTPPTLKKGDIVLLIATARKVSPEEMAPAIGILQSWGLKVETGKSLYASNHQFAGSDDERAADLQWALDHPDAKAILIARGGYGTLRIIDRPRFSGFAKNPKWLIGYSDVTFLHNELYGLGFQSLHATMPINFEKNAEATESLRTLLFGKKITYDPPAHPLNRTGTAEGELIGGNLSLMYAMKGSLSEPDFRGKILFLEDLDEYLYHIDRMILSMKLAGCFEALAGLIAGGMTEMKDNTIPFGMTAEEIVALHCKEYDFPICFNFPAGHIDRNLAFIHGARVRMEVTGKKSTVNYL